MPGISGGQGTLTGSKRGRKQGVSKIPPAPGAQEAAAQRQAGVPGLPGAAAPTIQGLPSTGGAGAATAAAQPFQEGAAPAQQAGLLGLDPAAMNQAAVGGAQGALGGGQGDTNGAANVVAQLIQSLYGGQAQQAPAPTAEQQAQEAVGPWLQQILAQFQPRTK